ncbi:hypothetical protein BJ508DRAFT_22578 [Ascobolus immersus RN42]|uniref:Uncharacterized protein n=1 Tax=Ascobolus immersus RN42 TaxID=1160509 RepID=A0A3N4HS07_ASCIM|nr:hypothetical protein BJ508DRAFT_22578 [Ascobolus immersus RN42]
MQSALSTFAAFAAVACSLKQPADVSLALQSGRCTCGMESAPCTMLNQSKPRGRGQSQRSSRPGRASSAPNPPGWHRFQRSAQAKIDCTPYFDWSIRPHLSLNLPAVWSLTHWGVLQEPGSGFN